MYLTLIFLPLLGSIISGFFGRKIGVKGAHFLTISFMVITTFLALIAYIEVGLNGIPVYIKLTKWLDSESLNVMWGFNFDALTVSMLIPVLVISTLVHIYSVEYMSHDPHNQRFFSYLSLFSFMMILLVTGDSFLTMFVGWEGVGVCSYLLINFWYTRIAANQSSISAFLTNRVGDCFLTIGILTLLWTFGNVDFYTVFAISSYINENIITLISICFIIGAMAKSSQIGLHVWLPMAMEGWGLGPSLNFTICGNTLFLKLWSTVHSIVLNLNLFLSKINTKALTLNNHPQSANAVAWHKWVSVTMIPRAIYQSINSDYVAVVNMNLGKIHDEGQSAGNMCDAQGSSETTCEVDYLNNKFKWWLIGFAEGDGSFIVNKTGYLEFKITQSSVDAQILFYIKKELGFGSVSIQSKENKTHHFRIRDKKNLLYIIKIFNGNIITKAKNDQFYLWLKSFNEKYNTNIQYIKPRYTVNLDNAWLSGFTDAEGCFTCSAYLAKTNKHIVTVRYVISQKNDIEFSNNLANLINGYITHIKSYNGYNTVVNFGKLNKILKYLKEYPLKTKKFISYKRWLKVYALVDKKEHLTPEGIEKIKKIIKLINK